MTTRVWNTQRPKGDDALLRHALLSVTIPDLSLSPFRAPFGAVNELSASITATFAGIGERIKAEYEKATEAARSFYNAMPRAVRRSQRKRRHYTADRSSKEWPGTEAVTPDHPARVIYKRLLSRDGVTSVLLDKALDRCGDADERAHRNADTAATELLSVADEVTPVTQETPERIAHQPRAPQLLMAVTSSRNQPADSHTRTVNSTQNDARQDTLRKA